MTRREELLEAFKAASESYSLTKASLENARFLARNGMPNNLAFAVAAEHSAYHRWLRAHEALANCR